MSLTPDERDQLEARHTFRRIAELELDPVRGNFDAAHLREIHRRIFQDLPGAGFDDVKPGEYRPPVPEGKDWMKNRGLSTVEGSFYVAYSRMDEAARTRLDKTLEGARPAKLRALYPGADGRCSKPDVGASDCLGQRLVSRFRLPHVDQLAAAPGRSLSGVVGGAARSDQ